MSSINNKVDFSDSKTDILHNPDEEGGFILVHEQDISGLVDDAQSKARELESISSRGEEMRPLMQIPGVLIEQYCIQNGVSWAEFWSPGENQKHIKRILTDPDLAYFRLRSFNSQCSK